MRQNLLSALRALRRAPKFALVTALSLALGTGAITAVFNVVNAFPETTRRLSSETEPTIDGVYWEAEELDGENVSEAFGARKPYLQFDLRESISGGSDGCDDIIGECEVQDGRLRLGAMWTTNRGCLDGKDQIREKFNRAWVSANKYKISGGKLELYRNSELRARFKVGQPPPKGLPTR